MPHFTSKNDKNLWITTNLPVPLSLGLATALSSQTHTLSEGWPLSPKAVSLGRYLNDVCTDCGGRGHQKSRQKEERLRDCGSDYFVDVVQVWHLEGVERALRAARMRHVLAVAVGHAGGVKGGRAHDGVVAAARERPP